MIADNVVLPGIVVTKLETNVEVVFEGLLGADTVETKELGNPVAMQLGATVVRLMLDVDGSSHSVNTIGFVKT